MQVIRSGTVSTYAIILLVIGPLIGSVPMLHAQAVAPPNAFEELKVNQGEILLEGRLQAMDAAHGICILEVESFTLPTGKKSSLATPKAKTVSVDGQTLLHVRGALGQKLTLAELTTLKQTIFAAVIGKDAGSGQSLPAREVALWDSIEAGQYKLKTNSTHPEPIVQSPLQSPTQNAPGTTSSPVAVTPGTNVSGTGVSTPATSGSSHADANGLEGDEAAETLANNIFPYGDFEDVDERGRPNGWTIADHERIKILEENGNHFLRIINPPTGDGKAGGFKAVPIRFKLKPGFKRLRLYARMRATHLIVGTKPWENARLAPLFEDVTGKGLGGPPVLDLKQDSDWVGQFVDVDIPDNAYYLVMSLETFASGWIDFDDIQVELNPPPHSILLRPGLPQGSFEQLDGLGNPLGWKLNDPTHTKVMEEDGNHFLRLTSPAGPDGKPINFVTAPCRFKLDPTWRKIQLRARMRAQNLKTGAQNYEVARLVPFFEGADGYSHGNAPTLDLKHDADWTNLQEKLDVPPGAIYLTLSPEMMGCSGIVDYDDIHVEPIP